MYEPKSDLGKTLLVIAGEVATLAPRSFEKIHLENALIQADAVAEQLAKSGGPPVSEAALICEKCRKPVARSDALQNSRVGLICPHCGGEVIRA